MHALPFRFQNSDCGFDLLVSFLLMHDQPSCLSESYHISSPDVNLFRPENAFSHPPFIFFALFPARFFAAICSSFVHKLRKHMVCIAA